MNTSNAIDIYFQTTIEVIKGKLRARNYLITIEKELPGGWQIRTSTGSIINIFRTGTLTLQGKSDLEIKEIVGFLRD